MEEGEELSNAEGTDYRGLAARANYLAADRADIQYAVKEICRDMSKPPLAGKRKIKRLARYLKGAPRVVLRYRYQKREEEAWGYSDSDWAGCKKTAKSTSGGAIVMGSHTLKTWSSTQKNITLSSGEAELVAAVKTCTETIGVTQMAKDWGGVDLEILILVDSNAATGIANIRGNGRMRHVKVGDL